MINNAFSLPTTDDNLYPKILPASESALIVYFADQPCDKTTSLIQSLQQSLSIKIGHVLIDMIPSFTSLLIHYNPLLTDHFYITNTINTSWLSILNDKITKDNGKTVYLPTYYNEAVGPDLPLIAENSGLSINEIINLHANHPYKVYCIGFAPGFAYLASVNPLIASPRLTTPRKRVPKGSVGIADRQTAIYPAESPGGWNLIGRCPSVLFDLNKQPIMPMDVGDTVIFESITNQQFIGLGGQL